MHLCDIFNRILNFLFIIIIRFCKIRNRLRVIWIIVQAVPQIKCHYQNHHI
eukprot:UN03440